MSLLPQDLSEEALLAICWKDMILQIHTTLLDDIQCFPWFGCHNNVNLAFKVYEQRLSNQSHFDSGTAGTILVIEDPDAVHPNNQAFQQQRALGAGNPITYKDIIKFEHDASPHLKAHAIHQVLMYFTTAPDFSFETYTGKKHPLFDSLPSLDKLPIGPEHIACHYMLNMVHIKEASYEGNDCILNDWWHQLKLDTVDKQKQTETFGWFHVQIAFEHSLHSQYYGTQLGFGLVHAFDLLKHKGLHSPTVEGTFHHHLKEGLLHISEARFHDLWTIVGKNKNYAVEILELLQGLHWEWPSELKTYIIKYCWLVNTTGQRNGFLPIDLLQEHNVQNIKHTFAVKGPYTDWDYIGKTSTSIPCQQKVKDHVESEPNHFLHGKSHSSPEKEEDITCLCMSYHASKIHSNCP
ncbi:hypothetical protein L208DRAFT_1374469 [Tricholoma matsutake]|nr:hypothetical protein L208DRAFT_1374469 [Tricholoma matsutake 945]